jgi:hypothetical protein
LLSRWSARFAAIPSFADYFPATIETDQQLISVVDFCRRYLRVPKRFASRRPSDLCADDWLFPDEIGPVVPLLKSVDQKHAKSAGKLSAQILGYCQNVGGHSLQSFVSFLQAETRLIDEAYVQVIRQARHHNPQFVYRMWELLLALSTLFMVSPVYEPFVRQFLATAAFGQNKLIVDIAQLAYLRFCSLSLLGSHFRAMPAAFIEQIPNHLNGCSFTFGASLRELMYRQRIVHSRMRIPMIMHWFTSHLITLGVIGAVRAFQLPVDKARIEEMVNKIDMTGEMQIWVVSQHYSGDGLQN